MLNARWLRVSLSTNFTVFYNVVQNAFDPCPPPSFEIHPKIITILPLKRSFFFSRNFRCLGTVSQSCRMGRQKQGPPSVVFQSLLQADFHLATKSDHHHEIVMTNEHQKIVKTLQWSNIVDDDIRQFSLDGCNRTALCITDGNLGHCCSETELPSGYSRLHIYYVDNVHDCCLMVWHSLEAHRLRTHESAYFAIES